MIDVSETVIIKQEDSTSEQFFDESTAAAGFDLEAVKERWETITDAGITAYSCEICMSEMFDSDSVLAHFKKHYEPPFTCHICNQTLTEICGLRRHIRRMHFVDTCRVTNAEGTTYYICDVCELPYNTEEEFQKHYRPHIYGKSTACDVCEKNFSSQNALKKHKAAVHFGVKFPCDICGKELATKWALTDHKNLHLNRRPYKCDTCGKDYPTFSGLNTHVSSKDCKGQNCDSQHGAAKVAVDEYFCHICILFFAGKEELTRHFFVKHKQERRDNMEKDRKQEVMTEGGVVKYKCDYCDMVFDYIRTMKSHRKRIHGKDRMNCDVCNRVFSSLRSLQWHRNQKHVKKRIRCDVCGKDYSSEPSMKRHKMKYHA